jgi:hypothetical protein
MHSVESLEALPGHRLRVEFADGLKGDDESAPTSLLQPGCLSQASSTPVSLVRSPFLTSYITNCYTRARYRR